MNNHRIHKYYRVVLGKLKDYIVYKCALPNCSHFVQRELAVNRQSLCWKCERPFILSLRDLTLAKPICKDCKVPKEEKVVENKTTELLRRMNINIGKKSGK